MATNAKLKLLKVAWGMFHRRALLWSAMIAGPTPAEYAWSNPEHTVWEKIKKRFDYMGTRQYGMELMESMSPMAYSLSYYGLLSFRMQDLGAENLQYKTATDKWLARQPKNAYDAGSKAVLRRMSWWTRQMNTEMFGIFGSSLKMAVGANKVRQLMKKHEAKITRERMESQEKGRKSAHFESFKRTNKDLDWIGSEWHSDTEAEILRTVAGQMNADFGNLNTRRLGLSEGQYDAARLLFLGPDWTLSNFQTVSKLWLQKDGRVGAGAWFSGSKIERDAYISLWLTVMKRVAAITIAINLIMAGFDDETMWERAKNAKKRKGFKVLQADISPIMHALGGDEKANHYFNVGGQFLDPLKWVFEPLRSAAHKSSAITKPVIRAIGGTDYRHRRPTDLWDIPTQGLNTYKPRDGGPLHLTEVPAFAIQEVMNMAPIQLQKLWALFMGEENMISAMMEGGAGLDVNTAR
jgi:hypothetical protein